MAVTRWDPLPDMMSLRQAMDRLMEDALVRPRMWASGMDGGSMLPVDLYETGDELVMIASMPGMKPEEIEITIQGDTLRIQGESKQEEIKDAQFHRRERHMGRFFREISLPMMVQADKVKAHFDGGMLTLHMPKAEAAKTRKVPIEGSSSSHLITPRAA